MSDLSFERACERAARYANRKNGDIKRASQFLLRAWSEDAHFGIESVSVADRSIEYLNQGDSYDTTVICENNVCSVSSWGDWVESAESEHCADENVCRCGYCGEFTDHSTGIDWRNLICEHCERLVTTGQELPARICHCDCGCSERITSLDCSVTRCDDCCDDCNG